MSEDSVSSLYKNLPHVFNLENVPEDWLAGYDVETDNPAHWVVSDQDEMVCDFTARDPRVLNDEDSPPKVPADLLNIVGGTRPGALIDPLASPPHPPPDCFAFYMPFHQFYPKWWGIYLLAPGVEWFARDLQKRCQMSPVDCFKIAKMYLYFHEAYHHAVECFAARLEVTHRLPAYFTGFERFYQSVIGTDECLEEGLAEAHALRGVLENVSLPKAEKAKLKQALTCMISDSPPGYRKGAEWYGRRMADKQALLAEKSHVLSFPSVASANPSIWGNCATYMFCGYTTIKSRVKYLIPKDQSLNSRQELIL